MLLSEADDAWTRDWEKGKHQEKCCRGAWPWWFSEFGWSCGTSFKLWCMIYTQYYDMCTCTTLVSIHWFPNARTTAVTGSVWVNTCLRTGLLTLNLHLQVWTYDPGALNPGTQSLVNKPSAMYLDPVNTFSIRWWSCYLRSMILRWASRSSRSPLLLTSVNNVVVSYVSQASSNTVLTDLDRGWVIGETLISVSYVDVDAEVDMSWLLLTRLSSTLMSRYWRYSTASLTL